MTWLWDKAVGWISAVGVTISLLVVAWMKARSEGRAAEREAEARHKAEAIANKRKLDDEIDGLASADVDSRFNRWVRKDER